MTRATLCWFVCLGLVAGAGSGSRLGAATVESVYLLDGSFADELGGPPIVGEGGTLGAGGYSFGPNQGLTLTGMSPRDDYSIELAFRWSDLGPQAWTKIVDFKDRTLDSGFYRFFDKARFYDPFDEEPPAILEGPSSLFAVNVDFHVVVTRDGGTKEFVAYVNGNRELGFVDEDRKAVFDVVRLLQDDTKNGGPEAGSGFVDQVRIYQGALTADEVFLLFSGGTLPGELEDEDEDGVADDEDNCVSDFNPEQVDADEDGRGDECDNCPSTANSGQEDTDGDGYGNACDNCPEDDNGDQLDSDGDGQGDACDPCPLDPDNDADGDGVCGDEDECPSSDLREVLVQCRRRIRVENQLLDSGCTMADLLAERIERAHRLGQLIVSVFRLTLRWRRAGLISRREQHAILLAATFEFLRSRSRH